MKRGQRGRGTEERERVSVVYKRVDPRRENHSKRHLWDKFTVEGEIRFMEDRRSDKIQKGKNRE